MLKAWQVSPAVATLWALTTVAAGCGEFRIVHRYETLADARRDGVFARGWVPDILPATATALVELHDLDTNARCAGARFQPVDRSSIRSTAMAVGFAVHEGARPAPPFRGCPFLIGNIMKADEVLRRDGSTGAEFLILTTDGQMHFWSN
ncbi:hypothetical protein [Luteitalea sp.]